MLRRYVNKEELDFRPTVAVARVQKGRTMLISPLQYNDLHSRLDNSNGSITSVHTARNPPDFPEPLHTSSASHLKPINPLSPRHQSHSDCTPCIAEAAEIASRQRRCRALRSSTQKSRLPEVETSEEVEEDVLATPVTHKRRGGSLRASATHASPRKSRLRPLTSQELSSLAEPYTYARPSWPAGADSSASAHGSPPKTRGTTARILDGPSLVATPPIAENDLEPVGPYSATESSYPLSQRPTPLDTLAAQEGSLPSPSLSPVTAAANAAQPNVQTDMDADDNSNEVSSLDLSAQSSSDGDASFENSLGNAQSRSGPFMEIPTMLSFFDSLPEQMQTYVMYHMLRRCAKPTLHFVADVVNPALKCDFLSLLPPEISLNITQYLDVKSMCSAAQVSKQWRSVVDTDERTWMNLLSADGYALPAGELERAVNEGWGWQYPHTADSWEQDLRDIPPAPKLETEHRVNLKFWLERNSRTSPPPPSGCKRKAILQDGPLKKQRRRGPSATTSSPALFDRSANRKQGPNALAELAVAAVPNPDVGLPSLRKMHLYKSLYVRHHMIRKSWMDPETKPKHIAFRAHERHVVTCLQFDTDKILTGSDDTNINVYDTKTGALRACLQGHEGGVWALQYDGNTLVSGSTDRSVRVWDIEKGKCTNIFQGHTSTVRCLVILKPTQIGTTIDGEPIMMPKEPLIITGSRDSSLRVWKLPIPGEEVLQNVSPNPRNDREDPHFLRVLNGHHHSVRAIAAHGDTLVSGSYDCTVRVWRISTGDVLHRLTGHTQKVYSVVLDPEHGRCISGSMDNLVKVWSLETGQCLFNLEGHTSLVGLLDLSHGRLVSAAADSTLRIWDPQTGSCKSTLCAHTGAITCFQHDAQKVISGSDRTLKMWNVQTGEFVRDLLTDLSGVWQVKFNERRCVAAVQRNQQTYIEVSDQERL